MKCKRDGCENELQGRQRDFCSDRCRKAQSRTNRTHEDRPGSPNADKVGQIPTPERGPLNADTLSRTDVTCSEIVTLKGDPDVTVGGVVRVETTVSERVSIRPPTLIGPEVYYHPRNHPERLNWGEHMTRLELDAAGLKANRVPIPGDWDYHGVVDDTGRVARLRRVG